MLSRTSSVSVGVTDSGDVLVSYESNNSLYLSVKPAAGAEFQPQRLLDALVERAGLGRGARAAAIAEEGVRLLSQVVDCPPEQLEIGMPVEVAFDDVTAEITLPKFRRASKMLAPAASGRFSSKSALSDPSSKYRQSKKRYLPKPVRSIRLRNCLGMIWSVSTLARSIVATTPV